MPQISHRGASHVDKKRLDYYKKKLLAHRDELLKTMRAPPKKADRRTKIPPWTRPSRPRRSCCKRIPFGVTNTGPHHSEHDRSSALKRIQKEELRGVCANCQDEMQQKRLEAVSWATHCVTLPGKSGKGHCDGVSLHLLSINWSY